MYYICNINKKDIVRDLWIMYVTATKIYYMRKETKKNNNKSHVEDEEIDRILKEAGVSDDSDTSTDLSSEDSDTDYSDTSDETVIEEEDESESEQHTSKKLKTTHKKKKKTKKHSQEEMIEEIHNHITSLTKNVPLVKLSVIFLYMGCLWLRLPVMISDFHT